MRLPIVILLSLLCASVAAASETKPAGDILVVPSVGVKFAVPVGWHERTGADVAESRQHVRLADPALNRYLKERARIPKLVFTKHDSDFPSLNPTLQVSTTATRGSTAEQIATASVQPMMHMTGFKLTEPPHAVAVRGRQAAVVCATFPLSKGEVTLMVQSWMLVVVDGDEAVVFGLSGQATGADRVDSDFQRLLASVSSVR
jgi:hypothetical protein